MSDLIVSPSALVPTPLPRIGISIRPGVLGDVPFMDSLQKLHTRQVGWMPTKQFEGKINARHVLIAETSAVGATPASPVSPDRADSPRAGDAGVAPAKTPVGYLIGNDQYFKHDDVGIIYQMNVLPGRQRGMIGASLLRAQFDRSAWGCKLYCCWCAQDIAANRFWEAMGFVPLAFRAGSEKKARVHIFWQKRIRQDDTTTPWWFPSKTGAGSLREDRIVLPIPPGTHWSDAKPLIFPQAPGETTTLGEASPAVLPAPKAKRANKEKPAAVVEPLPVVNRNGLRFDIPQPGEALPVIVPVGAKKTAAKRTKAEKVKRLCDPRLVSAARELRDRWLEQINAAPLLPSGKYDVCRAITGPNARSALTSVQVMELRAMHQVRCLPPGEMAA